jgi:hypothetical protein
VLAAAAATAAMALHNLAAAAGFGSVEELGEAWHTVVGNPAGTLSIENLTALLPQHQAFAHRCSMNTDRSFFFGPSRELLWEIIDLEYCRSPRRQRVAREMWSKLRLLYIAQRQAQPSCLLSMLNDDLLRARLSLAPQSVYCCRTFNHKACETMHALHGIPFSSWNQCNESVVQFISATGSRRTTRCRQQQQQQG